jgi:hypothetical protein
MGKFIIKVLQTRIVINWIESADIKLNKLAVALIPKESFTVSEVGIV